MSSSVLAAELADLQEKIGHVRRKHQTLEDELRTIDAELERLGVDRQRFAAVQDVCQALDRLVELKADDIFWEGVANPRQAAGLVERARNRVTSFEGKLHAVLEQQAALKKLIQQCVEELIILDYEVSDAYEREARRGEEYVVEREISPVPNRTHFMPWSNKTESETLFRRAVLVSLLVAVSAAALITLLHVPAPVRPAVVEIPERLVSMLREEPKKEPAPPKEEKKPEKDEEKKAPEKAEEKKPQEEQAKQVAQEKQVVRQRVERAGILAYKETLKDLMDEAPAAKVGAEARLSSQPVEAVGESRQGGRSALTMPSANASSGGISDAAVNRTVNRESEKHISNVTVTRVQSNTAASQAAAARPAGSVSTAALSAPGTARTDEEIQIIFDRYKATLYRMYNAELRRNPTLRGKLVLRVTIEPGGEVSACQVQSSDLNSPELIAQIVDRVKRFNFGPKDKAPSVVILYPIDFLPAG